MLCFIIFFTCFYVYGNAEEIFYNGRKTYLVSDVRKNWTSAELFCKEKNMEMVTFDNDSDAEFFANNIYGWTWTGYTFNDTNNDWTDFNGNVATFSTSTTAGGFLNKCLVVYKYSKTFAIAGDPCITEYRCACQGLNSLYNGTNHSITPTTSSIGEMNKEISEIFFLLQEINQSLSDLRSLSEKTNIFYQNFTSTMEQFHPDSIQMKKYWPSCNDTVKVQNETRSHEREFEKLKVPCSSGMEYFLLPVYLLMNIITTFVLILCVKYCEKAKKRNISQVEEIS